MKFNLPKKKNTSIRILLAIIVLCFVFVFSLLGGLSDVSLSDIWQQILHASGFSIAPVDPERFNLITTILWEIRLPRAILAMLVGIALGVSGVLVQALFRNPLAEPGLIGISAGSATATLCGMVLSGTSFFNMLQALGVWYFPVTGFIGGLISTGIVFKLATRRGNTDVTHLLLTGVAMNAFSGAIIALLLTVASDQSLRSFVFWSLGSFSQADTQMTFALLPFVALPTIFSFFLIKPLNLLLFGEAEAFHLGVEVPRLKRIIIVLVSLMAAAAVSLVGIISFVGLIVPHLVRLYLGPNHRFLIPGAAIVGATLLLVADYACRQFTLGQEIPIGILTSLVGAPFFLFLLYNSRTKFIF